MGIDSFVTWQTRFEISRKRSCLLNDVMARGHQRCLRQRLSNTICFLWTFLLGNLLLDRPAHLHAGAPGCNQRLQLEKLTEIHIVIRSSQRSSGKSYQKLRVKLGPRSKALEGLLVLAHSCNLAGGGHYEGTHLIHMYDHSGEKFFPYRSATS